MLERDDTQFLDADYEVQGCIANPHNNSCYSNPGVGVASRTVLDGEMSCNGITDQRYER
jgi:hypothetical protein